MHYGGHQTNQTRCSSDESPLANPSLGSELTMTLIQPNSWLSALGLLRVEGWAPGEPLELLLDKGSYFETPAGGTTKLVEHRTLPKTLQPGVPLQFGHP
jgi:hypothetical protein